MPNIIETWNPTTALLLMFMSVFFTLLGKILWDWVQAFKTKGDSEQCQTHAEEISLIKLQLKRFETDMEAVQETIKEISDFKISLMKSELYLSSISKSIDKLDKYLEKNLDEIFTRLRKAEATLTKETR